MKKVDIWVYTSGTFDTKMLDLDTNVQFEGPIADFWWKMRFLDDIDSEIMDLFETECGLTFTNYEEG